jgi:glutamate synthase domain-containing protein 2
MGSATSKAVWMKPACAKWPRIPRSRLFEIKLSQGAKPGKGGILPAAKVTPEIAAIRGIPVGQDSRSPNRHPEIADVAALLDFVARVRTITGKPAGFKLVIGDPAGSMICAGKSSAGVCPAPPISSRWTAPTAAPARRR